MAVQRQANLLGQQRVDIPHLRSIESAMCGDFDMLAGNLLAGKNPLVIRGFNINFVGAIGAQASALTLVVANAALIHFNASGSVTRPRRTWSSSSTPCS